MTGKSRMKKGLVKPEKVLKNQIWYLENQIDFAKTIGRVVGEELYWWSDKYIRECREKMLKYLDELACHNE